MPEAPQLSGWQYVILEVVKMLVPILTAILIGGYAVNRADKADERAAEAGRTATEARSEVGKFRVMYGKAPE